MVVEVSVAPDAGLKGRPLCHRKNSPSVIAVDDLPSAGMCHAASIVRSRL